MSRLNWVRSRWVVIGFALVASLTMVTAALASPTDHIYPSTGYGTYYGYHSSVGNCNGSSYDWSHQSQVGVHGYYPQEEVQIQLVNFYGAWENSSYTMAWFITYLVDGTSQSNTRSYTDLVGDPFTSSSVFYPWHDLNYDNPGANPYVQATWYNGIDTQTCKGTSYLMIHGPN